MPTLKPENSGKQQLKLYAFLVEFTRTESVLIMAPKYGKPSFGAYA